MIVKMSRDYEYENKNENSNSNNENGNNENNVKLMYNNYDNSYFPHGIIPENPANGGYAKEIAHTATVCLNWWKSGVKSVKMIGDLTGLEPGYVLIVLQHNCGINEKELKEVKI